jgi:hypothetical protein
VPEVSRFLGIIIAIYYREHTPPHYHAIYGDYEITVEIETGIVSGKFPKRALSHVLEWHGLHKEELLENWKFAVSGETLRKIKPLE